MFLSGTRLEPERAGMRATQVGVEFFESIESFESVESIESIKPNPGRTSG